MPISKFFLPWAQAMLKPYRAINQKIHEATGRVFPGGWVEKRGAGTTESATFRQVGSIPGDASGFPAQHLGDNK